MLDELKTDYDESSEVIPEFVAYVDQLKNKLETKDALKLEEFTRRLAKVSRSAKKGVDAMWELSINHRKSTADTLREYEAFQ